MLDFRIKYDSTQPKDLIIDGILQSLIISRLKYKKPCVIFLSGDSGEGKSWTALQLMYRILSLQGIDMAKVNDIINVHTPLEYPQKLQKLLYPEKYANDHPYKDLLKKTNVFCVHEARTVVNSKDWQDFVTKAIPHVNALSRSIKRICFIIVSQFIRDITQDVRYTLNYYGKCKRTIGIGSQLRLYKLWKDDRDLDKPKLNKRKIKGQLVSSGGRAKSYMPDYFLINRPPKPITEQFEKADLYSKGKIINSMMEKMIREMETRVGVGSDKLTAMVKWYTNDINELRKVGRTTKTGRWVLKKDLAKIHDLTPSEFKDFQALINEKIKEELKT